MNEQLKGVANVIDVNIKSWVGNLVRFDYYDDGTRGLLDVPYRQSGKTARFTLPSGKKKVERFHSDLSDEMILSAISKKYNNFKFKIATP